MTDDKNEVYRKLLYFYKNEIAVHLKLFSGVWRNGIISSLNREEKMIILKEFVVGEIPLLFEEINPNTIAKFIKVGENGATSN